MAFKGNPSSCAANLDVHLQFAVGGSLALLMWALNLHERPKVSKDTVRLKTPPEHFGALNGEEKCSNSAAWPRQLGSRPVNQGAVA